MSGLFNFEVHTPFRLFYSGQAKTVTLALVDGEIGIYANHSPFSAVTATGILRIMEESGKWRAAFVSGGILEVKKDKNVLMVDSAEWPEEIDLERALTSKRQAEEDLAAGQLKFETVRLKAKLRRAEFRLKVLSQ